MAGLLSCLQAQSPLPVLKFSTPDSNVSWAFGKSTPELTNHQRSNKGLIVALLRSNFADDRSEETAVNHDSATTNQETKPAKPEREERTESKTSWRNILFLIGICIISILTAVIVSLILVSRMLDNYYYDKKGVDGKIKNMKNDLSAGFEQTRRSGDDFKGNTNIGIQQNVLQGHEVDKLAHKIEKIEKDIELLNETIQSYHKRLAELVEEKMKFLNPPAPNEATPQIFFMPAPSENGVFKDASKIESFNPSVVMYKFNLIRKDEARFSFNADEVLRRDAINSPYRYLEPVCEIENPYHQNPRGVKTITEGKAVREGESWKITQKARIKYE